MALSTTTAAELTAEQVSTILTEPLAQTAQFLAAGPRIFDTNGAPVRVPALPAQTEAEFVGENELIPETDPELTEVTLLPTTMKSVKTLTRYSNELARQSIVSLDNVLQQRLVSDVAATIDKQLFSADGDGVEIPQGLFAWEGTTAEAVDGPLTLDAVMSGLGAAMDSHVNTAALRLVIRPSDYMALRAAKDGDNRYMLTPDAVSGGMPTPLGLQPVISSYVPEGSAALVDFSQVAVARDLAPSVKILTERYADYDQQAIRVVARYDAKPLNGAGAVKLTGITAG